MSSDATVSIDPKATAQEIVRWGLDNFSPDIAAASSFGAEDIVVIHMMKQVRDDIRVFSLDTGRMHEETYACADAVRSHLGVNIEWYFPDRTEVEKLERAKGLYSFRESVENRKECCGVRKVEPLNRALGDLKAWITGLRRDQNVTRGTVEPVETDQQHGGIKKLNPLADWPNERVWDYIHEHKLPYNELHDRGFPSIGCAPCTRAIDSGEDERAGRWWWENPENKECGLHLDHDTDQDDRRGA